MSIGEVFIEKEKLEDFGIFHPIKLVYFKEINNVIENEKTRKVKYGISIVKTDYYNNELKVEENEIKYLSNDEEKVNEILQFLKDKQVTPINLEEVLLDLFKEKLFNRE